MGSRCPEMTIQVEGKRAISGSHAVTSLNPHTNSLRSKIYWTGWMAQPAKCLLCKSEHLGSILRTHIRTAWCKLVIPALSGWSPADHEGSPAKQPNLIEKCQVSGRPWLRKQDGQHPRMFSGLFMHVHRCAYTLHKHTGIYRKEPWLSLLFKYRHWGF